MIGIIHGTNLTHSVMSARVEMSLEYSHASTRLVVGAGSCCHFDRCDERRIFYKSEYGTVVCDRWDVRDAMEARHTRRFEPRRASAELSEDTV